jgi:hypothetical protein
LLQRVTDARTNVVAAMGAAATHVPVVRHLEQAAYDWRIEAERIEHDLRVAEHLLGEPRKQAVKVLRGRVDELVDVADRIVDTAFVERLVPSSEVTDRLLHATEHLDALDQARRELDGLLDTPGWIARVRVRVVAPLASVRSR